MSDKKKPHDNANCISLDIEYMYVPECCVCVTESTQEKGPSAN